MLNDFEIRADRAEKEQCCDHATLWSLVKDCVDFGVKLGVLTVGSRYSEPVPRVTELLDEVRSKLTKRDADEGGPVRQIITVLRGAA
jgi:hypothetical protein